MSLQQLHDVGVVPSAPRHHLEGDQLGQRRDGQGFDAYRCKVLEPSPDQRAGQEATLMSWLYVTDVTELAHISVREVFYGNDS